MSETSKVLLNCVLPSGTVRMLLIEASHYSPAIAPYFLGYIGIPATEAIKTEANKLLRNVVESNSRFSNCLYDVVRDAEVSSPFWASWYYCPASLTYSLSPVDTPRKDSPSGDNCYWLGYDKAGTIFEARNDTKDPKVINLEITRIIDWATAVESALRNYANPNVNSC